MLTVVDSMLGFFFFFGLCACSDLSIMEMFLSHNKKKVSLNFKNKNVSYPNLKKITEDMEYKVCGRIMGALRATQKECAK